MRLINGLQTLAFAMLMTPLAGSALARGGDAAADGDEADAFADALVSEMTLAEKIGQMTQVNHDTIIKAPDDVRVYGLGSILSGGGEGPTPNTPQAWADMIDKLQGYALRSRLAIPMLYGIDAVHGHNTLKDAIIFPHNIGLGATRDLPLVRAVAEATGIEVAATGIRWDFAPTSAVVQDIRWGRTYESFSEDTALTTKFARVYVEGLQNIGPFRSLSDSGKVLATPKHFVGDGGTTYGTSRVGAHLMDRGDTRISEETLRAVHLPPFIEAINAGAESIMVSYSSWNGLKMHAHKYLLTDVLKGELGFRGFLISDWMAVDELQGDERTRIKTTINAGLDMVMVPITYKSFIANLTDLVKSGEVPESRIDDAVRRILRVKYLLGLFEAPYADRSLQLLVASPLHRSLGRQAVAESAVLLKNDGGLLPLSPNLPSLLIAGTAADDLGAQCGGWTMTWQGGHGPITAGTTFLAAVRQAVDPATQLSYSPSGIALGAKAAVGIAVVAEPPYAEYYGDRQVPALSADDLSMIANLRQHADKVIVLVYSGRPLVMTPVIEQANAVVAAFLPGSEGEGLADVFFGDQPFSGKLSFGWPRAAKNLPKSLRQSGDLLYPFGYGLNTTAWSDK